MNILQWLKNKSGKLPVTLAQVAGITAVVGAAGIGALTFLSAPADNNNTFLPPSAQQGEVVYISQNGGGGRYEANGEVGSSFKAAPSRSIQLANEQANRQAQTRVLEESSQQMPSLGTAEGPVAGQMPQAYQLSGADLGQGLGGGKNKDMNGSLDSFSTIQNQLAGVSQLINNAQAQAGANQASAKPGAPAAASGQNAAQLASAPRNWGSGGLTRSGGGNSGSANSFAVQNSGKNQRGGAEQAAAMAQAGDAIAQAQAAMAQLQEGGPRMRSQASFGRSEGLKEDKDARTSAARRFGNAKSELEFIRKQSAAIAKNKTNSANEAGRPFLASSKISGGLTVNGEQVTTGQSSSGDLKSNFDKQIKGINAKMSSLANDFGERTKKRHELRKWMWWALPLAMTMIPLIGALVAWARLLALNPLTAGTAAVVRGIAYALAGVTLYPVVQLLIAGVSYMNQYGADGYSIFAAALGGALTTGVGLALWSFNFGAFCFDMPIWVWGAGIVAGFGGSTLFKFLSENGDGYTDEQLDDNSGGKGE